MTQVRFIDVSSNDHENEEPINWHEVYAAGYLGTIIKATQSVDYINPFLEEDANKAKEAGLHYIGYYHFAISGASSALDQANFFAEKIAGLPRNIGGTLDQETQDDSWGALAEWSDSFLNRLEDLYIGPKLYSNGNFLTNMPGAPFGFPLWFASPGVKPRRNVWAWQNSWTTKVPGVPSEYTDTNILYLA